MHPLPRRLSRCVLKGEPFNEGMDYVSFLDADGHRKDYCLHCWQAIEKPGIGNFWKGKIPFRKDKRSTPDEKALDIFRQSTDPKQRFILALYLKRKQQLVQRTQTLYEIPQTGEVFDIEKVSVTLEETDKLARAIDGSIS